MTAIPNNTSSAQPRPKPIGPLEKTLRAMRNDPPGLKPRGFPADG